LSLSEIKLFLVEFFKVAYPGLKQDGNGMGQDGIVEKEARETKPAACRNSVL